MTAAGRSVGVVVMPEFVQSEGPRVLENLLRRARATAVVTAACVAAPADAATGTREPPAAGALLDRPLWGRRELMMRVAPAFAHDPARWRDLRYRPPEPDELTRREGPGLERFMDDARAAGLEVHLRVQAAAPPGYRAQFGGPEPDDEPLLPDGTRLPARLDRNGSLASPHIRAYLATLIAELAQRFPGVAGFHVDWPEYPPYSLDAVFADFSPHACAAAVRLGYDVERMRRDTLALRATLLGGLDDGHLRATPPPELAQGLARAHPGFLDLLRLKADLVVELLALCRTAATDASGHRRAVTPMVFPPPFSFVSGMDHARVAHHADALALKLIPSHWPMLLRAYGDALTAANLRLSEPVLVRTLAALLDIADGPAPEQLARWGHPADGEAFDPGEGPQRRKIEAVRRAAAPVPVLPLLHSLGPLADFRARLALTFAAAHGRLWVNRYGFLSDAKLDAIGALT